jgi:glutamyl-tRNA synthetase
MGYLPEALVNFLVRLGWSSGDQEIFTREELIRDFRLEDVGKSAGVFNPEKLLWLNAHYIKERPLPRLAEEVRPFIEEKGYALNGDSVWLEKMVATLQPRAKTLVELVNTAHYYLSNDIPMDPKARAKFLTPEIQPVLSNLRERLAQLQTWELTTIQGAFEKVMGESHLAMGKIAQPVRVALTGGTASPGIFEVMEVLGRDCTLSRLDQALTLVGKSS